ncbi:MAG: hypothetical protein MJZ16_01780 [Bacteroidales bacterium]|nr:hypothetical protein [Bacteroidales bacterium]
MKRFFSCMLAAASIFLLSIAVSSCGDDGKGPEEPEKEDFTLLIDIATPLEVYGGQDVTFNVLNKKGPKSTDQVVLKSSTNEFVCPIKLAEANFFTFTITEQVVSGSYTFGIRRGTTTKNIGKIDLTVKKVIKVEPKDGYNVYGIVTCGEEGVKDVIISDGSEFTKTDANGVYYLKSAEKYAIVYMTIPSGYQAENIGVLPQFYKAIDGNNATTDRADFVLEKVSGQDNHTMLFFGDMHLANRNKDIQQFHVFTDEVNAYLKENSGKKVYAQSLGDMTWDLYWYSQKMSPTEYVAEINKSFPNNNLTLYHCIGNHDHEMGSKITGYPIGDYNCEIAYRKALGPNFYSYNIGQVHYVVLDDIECTNDGVEKSSSGGN